MLEVLLTLHVLVFVMAFALTAGIGILSARIARSGDARVIHTVFAAARPLSIAGGTGWIVAGALGALLAVRMGTPLDRPWLLWSYAAFAVLVVSGLFLHAPWQARVIAASAASSDGAVGPDLAALLRSPLSPAASAISAVAFIALIYLMIAQPG